VESIGKVTDEVLAKIEKEMSIRKTTELFLMFGLGSQYDSLILKVMAKLGVLCLPCNPGLMKVEDVQRLQPKGIIYSGGPISLHAQQLDLDAGILDLDIPVLGICLGAQFWAQHEGASIVAAESGEYGRHNLEVLDFDSSLLHGVHNGSQVLQSHADMIRVGEAQLAAGWQILARTSNCPVAVVQYRHFYGVQFHPEVVETTYGEQIFSNFCFQICGALDVFPVKATTERKIRELRAKIRPGQRVLLALSGGCDSNTVAELLLRARPDELWAIYIKGVDRPDDADEVERFWRPRLGDRLIVVDATDRFLEALRGVIDMHQKRLAVRSVYVPVIEEVAAKMGAIYIAQGTLYTDLTESGHGVESTAVKARIKLHHNVGLVFTVNGVVLVEITPLDDCHKDSGRQIGKELGLPDNMLWRQPFPGPGNTVRIDGEITAEKLAIIHEVDRIFMQALRDAGLYEEAWQAGAHLTDVMYTTSKGDEGGKGRLVVLWAVKSVDGHTATAMIPSAEFLTAVAIKVTNEVPGVGMVTWRLSDKPPTTIEMG